ncbi:MAG: CarD family transcriptional regulator [Clostridiales bacterium]|nr:CarD family transcriptional regulator [Clostridiales bacterium]
MFTIGDKIVHPMHGAGVIEEIEEMKILGEVKKYYVLKFPCGDMKIMIPVDSTKQIGVRSVVSVVKLEEAISILESESSEMSANWNRRYRENSEKLKTGDVLEVAEVVRNLMRTDREKKLSTGEKKMLSDAKQILLSEIILIMGIDVKEANNIIDKAV